MPLGELVTSKAVGAEALQRQPWKAGPLPEPGRLDTHSSALGMPGGAAWELSCPFLQLGKVPKWDSTGHRESQSSLLASSSPNTKDQDGGHWLLVC